jgi:hypothetical protein
MKAKREFLCLSAAISFTFMVNCGTDPTLGGTNKPGNNQSIVRARN